MFNTILELSPKHSYGFEISLEMLKTILEELLVPLAAVINLYKEEGVFADELKFSK